MTMTVYAIWLMDRHGIDLTWERVDSETGCWPEYDFRMEAHISKLQDPRIMKPILDQILNIISVRVEHRRNGITVDELAAFSAKVQALLHLDAEHQRRILWYDAEGFRPGWRPADLETFSRIMWGCMSEDPRERARAWYGGMEQIGQPFTYMERVGQPAEERRP